MDRLHDIFGDSLALIRYHGWWPDSGDPFYLANPTESRERILYLYQHQQFPNDGLYAPHFFVDMLFDADANVALYETKVRQALAVPSLVTMGLALDLDFAVRDLTVTLTGEAESPIGGAPRVRFALTESDLSLPSGGPAFHQVMRDMFPSSAGIPVDLTTTQAFSVQTSVALSPSWEIHNLEVVAFVQEDTQGRVYQTAKARMPSDLPWFRLVRAEASESGSGDGDGVLNPGEHGTVSLVIRTDPAWGAVANVSVTLVSLSDLVTVTQGLASLPDMAPGDTARVAPGALLLAVSPLAGFGLFPMEVRLEGTYGSGSSYVQTIPITVLVSMNQHGFPVLTAGEVLSSPAVFSLPSSRGTGIAIAVGDETGLVHALDGSGAYLPGFPVQAGARVSASPAVADIDGDGVPEILVGSWDTHLYCFGLDGTTRWALDLGGYVTGPAAIGDVDGDGTLEVVAGTMTGDLWVVEADGSPAPGWPIALGATQRMSAGICLADVDGDGAREIIVGTWGKNVYLFSGDGVALPGWPVSFTKEVKAGIVTTSLPGVGLVLLVPCLDDALHVLAPSGEVLGSITLEGDLMSTPAVSDLDGDGRLEIVATAANGYVHVLGDALQELPGWPVALGTRIETSPVVADLDADGVPEVIIGGDDGALRVLRAGGTSLLGPLALGARIRSTPAVADVDDDADLEVFVGCGTQLVGLDFKASGGSTHGMWAQYRGVATRTGDWRDIGAVSTPHPPSLPTTLALYGVRPNPAASVALVTLALPSRGAVRLDLVDVAGRRMRTMQQRGLEAGVHRIPVDVSGLPQGVYFVSVSTEEGMSRAPVVVLH